MRVEIKSFPGNFKQSGYFGLIAITLIVAAALCWGFAHIQTIQLVND